MKRKNNPPYSDNTLKVLAQLREQVQRAWHLEYDIPCELNEDESWVVMRELFSLCFGLDFSSAPRPWYGGYNWFSEITYHRDTQILSLKIQERLTPQQLILDHINQQLGKEAGP